MTSLLELCTWLRANSSGVYRPAAEAADVIEHLAHALTDIMDGMPDHDIAGETGLPPADCDRIARVRAEASALLRELAQRGPVKLRYTEPLFSK